MLGNVSIANREYLPYDSSHLRAAGIGHAEQETSAGCLTWNREERPETPKGLKKYRQSTLHTPGQIFRHFGVADDPVDTKRAYGKVRPCGSSRTFHRQFCGTLAQTNWECSTLTVIILILGLTDVSGMPIQAKSRRIFTP
jgi:hypothetical protein